jgi:hypothetical protein
MMIFAQLIKKLLDYYGTRKLIAVFTRPYSEPAESSQHPHTLSFMIFFHLIILPSVALGGLVVSVLATGPRVRGFKPGRD